MAGMPLLGVKPRLVDAPAWCGLTGRHQYHHRAFHQVRRKGAKVTTRINLPQEARARLDGYMQEVHGALSPAGNGSLFASRGGKHLTMRGVAYICERLAAPASVNLPEAEKFHLTPHQLRHTFSRRAADKHGLHFAQELSGNVGMREIFRYTKPSQSDIETTVEALFDVDVLAELFCLVDCIFW